MGPGTGALLGAPSRPVGICRRKSVVDLGSSVNISQVQLDWDSVGRYATSYTIQISPDNINWTTVATLTGQNGGNDTITFTAVMARYVKMNSTAWTSNSERNYLDEIEIYQ